MPTDVRLKSNPLSTFRVKESIQATMLNMSAASKNGLVFFGLTYPNGRDTWIAIDDVSELIDVPEANPEGLN
jgi:hypothetical protein